MYNRLNGFWSAPRDRSEGKKIRLFEFSVFLAPPARHHGAKFEVDAPVGAGRWSPLKLYAASVMVSSLTCVPCSWICLAGFVCNGS